MAKVLRKFSICVIGVCLSPLLVFFYLLQVSFQSVGVYAVWMAGVSAFSGCLSWGLAKDKVIDAVLFHLAFYLSAFALMGQITFVQMPGMLFYLGILWPMLLSLYLHWRLCQAWPEKKEPARA